MARNTRKIRRTGGPSYGKGQSVKSGGKPRSRKILTEGEKKDTVSERVRKKVMAKKPAAKKPAAKKSVSTKKSLPVESKGRAMVKRGGTSPVESPKTGEYIPRNRTVKTAGRQGTTINANRNHTKEYRADHPTKTKGAGKAGKATRGAAGKTLGRVAGAAGRLAGGLGAAYLAGQVAKKVTDAADKNLGYSGGGRKGRKGSSSSPKKTPASVGPSTRPNNKPTAKTGGASTSFSQAFAKARKARLAGGKETFEWNGKTYHSYQKGETPLKYQKDGEAKRTKDFATNPSYRPKGKNKPNK